MKSMCALFRAIPVLMTILMMVSCKPSVPRKYIQPGKMEDILYDYHLADAFANMEGGSNATLQLTYQQAVLKKYGVTQADFDSSMVYYFRHTECLHDIYENLAKRFTDETKSLGGKGQNDYTVLSAKGDTANIWQGNRSEILLTTPPENKMSFVVKADTSFHQGDHIIFNFKTLFLFQEGVKNAVGVLSVRYNNDSITSQIHQVSSNGNTAIRIDDVGWLGIKEIRGYIFLTNNLNTKSQTYKLLSVYDIQLIRIHPNSKNIETDKRQMEVEEEVGVMHNHNIPERKLSTSPTFSPDMPRTERQVTLNSNIEKEEVIMQEEAPKSHERILIQPRKRR